VGNLREDCSSDSNSLSLAGSKNREAGRCICLRRGCDNHFTPRRWNQQFCGQPECQQLLRRWQAAKRQRRVRQTAEGRARHNQRERERRLAKRQLRNQAGELQPTSPAETAPSTPAERAWSRCKLFPKDFCDRPGCYDPVRPSRSQAARYCGDECRKAVERVRDRCRKRLVRQQLKNDLRLLTQRQRWQPSNSEQVPMALMDEPPNPLASGTQRVRNYWFSDSSGLSSEAFSRRQVDDQQRNSGSRSRPPPAQE